MRKLNGALGITMRTTTFLCLISLAALTAIGQTPATQVVKRETANKPRAVVSQSFEKEGIAVAFSIESLLGANGANEGLVAGMGALVSFLATDKRTDQPITGLRPKAWISARKVEHAPNETECKDKIRTFMGGLLSARPDIDLSSYSMVTLNHDKSVTFINPQICNFSISRGNFIETKSQHIEK